VDSTTDQMNEPLFNQKKDHEEEEVTNAFYNAMSRNYKARANIKCLKPAC
jgi:hypothetical protein